MNIELPESPPHAFERPAKPSAIAQLRVATWPSHQRLEKRIDVKARFASLEAYRAHLENLHGFCAPLETRVPLEAFGEALPDYPARRKLALLARDLASLGHGVEAIAALPRCPDLASVNCTAGAFGSIYVLEGATLGGRTLLPVVASRLGLTAAHGAAFLASYGDAVGAMWNRFGAALDAWCSDQGRRDAAEAAAIATFESLERWLCRVPG